MPVCGSVPTNETSSPNAAAHNPRSGDDPDSTATMDRPNTARPSISGEPKDSIKGLRMGMLTASRKAPNTPPRRDAVKAAPNALPACPRRASGWPSRMVAAEPDVPGTPNKTAGMVSDVVVTEPMPSNKAKAE